VKNKNTVFRRSYGTVIASTLYKYLPQNADFTVDRKQVLMLCAGIMFAILLISNPVIQ